MKHNFVISSEVEISVENNSLLEEGKGDLKAITRLNNSTKTISPLKEDVMI